MGGIAKAVRVLPVLVAIATVVQTVLSSSVTDDASAFLAGELTDDEFRDAVAPVSAIGTLTTLATLAAMIVTIIWMYRIASNVRALGRRTTWSPLFSIFGWVLPPFLFLIPFLVLRELWKASEPTDDTSDDSSDDAWRRTRDTPLLWVWLVTFGVLPTFLLAVEVSSLTSTSLGGGALDSQAEALDDFGIVQWLSALLTVIAAGVWYPFVRQLTARHRTLTHEP